MEEISRLPGQLTDEAELRLLGFIPLSINVIGRPEPGLSDWDTGGDVPDAAGHYVFTAEDATEVRVSYAGLSEHLWMITHGHLPHSGGARPGNRYGRPKYAGKDRWRINERVTEQLDLGRRVRHWVRPLTDTPNDRRTLRNLLERSEEELIVHWRLRQVGWNRR